MQLHETSSAQDLCPGCILVVDDSQAIRERLSSLMIRFPGVDCILEASSRTDGLRVAETARPAVVLVDAHLGAGESEMLLRELSQRLPGSCLIALVRYNSEQITENYCRAGATHCFDKGMELARLLDVVAQRIADGKQRSEA